MDHLLIGKSRCYLANPVAVVPLSDQTLVQQMCRTSLNGALEREEQEHQRTRIDSPEHADSEEMSISLLLMKNDRDFE